MIVLPFPPATLSGHANGNGRWRKIAVTKDWREKARKAAIDALSPVLIASLPEHEDIHVHVSFFPPDRRGDRFNYPNRLKPVVDGIADALKVNDRRFHPHFYFCPIDRVNPRVEVRIATA